MSIFNQLIDLRKNAYAKYSNYKVTCIVLDENDKQYFGVNVENSAYPNSICAERSAIVSAISNGSKKIKEVHLLCSSKNDFGTPCGACRQVMSEFMEPNNLVYIYNDLGESKQYRLDDLIPFSFSKKDLKGVNNE